MRFRKQRIAWSVLWGLAAVLLIVLWVRSYHAMESAVLQGSNQYLAVASEVSSFQIGWCTGKLKRSALISMEISGGPEQLERVHRERYGILGFGMMFAANSWVLTLPHWFLVFLFAAVATTPWLRWRFSLRTLLIATALVAVLLGLLVYATRTH